MLALFISVTIAVIIAPPPIQAAKVVIQQQLLPKKMAITLPTNVFL
jgi:hypothetical protein